MAFLTFYENTEYSWNDFLPKHGNVFIEWTKISARPAFWLIAEIIWKFHISQPKIVHKSRNLCARDKAEEKNRSQKIKSTKNVMPKANKKKATALLWNIHIVIPVFHEIIKSLIQLCVLQLSWLILLCSCRNADHSSLLFRH